MEYKYFTDGGFVIHRIPTRAGASRLTAWYDAQGNLLDCEAFNVLGYPYRPARVDREHCETLGKHYKRELV